VKTMMPKLHSTNFKGMELIRPMYMVREAHIQGWARYNGLRFLQCACRFTEQCANADGQGESKRQEIKELIQSLRKTNPYIDRNVFGSVHNVNLETLIGYCDKNGRHSFLDTYDQKGSMEDDTV
jgi:tRNA 2-thiocytidine biosynthesis protein TtcA